MALVHQPDGPKYANPQPLLADEIGDLWERWRREVRAKLVASIILVSACNESNRGYKDGLARAVQILDETPIN